MPAPILPFDDYNLLISFLNDEKCVDINLWQQVEKFEELKSVKKGDCCFADKSGIYAIIDNDGHIAYIGKAKCLHNRLSSHSWALVGKDAQKAPTWDEFFTHFNGKNLIARYFITPEFSDDRASEFARQAIERALQIKYKPYFDELYSRKKDRLEDRFDGELAVIKSRLEKI